MRDHKRLTAIRKLPCVRCGNPPPSEACHANWAEFGKSMGRKAGDEYTIPLCRNHHQEFDQFQNMNRSESVEWFAKMLEKTELMLNIKAIRNK